MLVGPLAEQLPCTPLAPSVRGVRSGVDGVGVDDRRYPLPHVHDFDQLPGQIRVALLDEFRAAAIDAGEVDDDIDIGHVVA